jgi:hypothetical protein
MILSIAGTALSAIGGLQQASAASAVAEENARIQAANARLAAEGESTRASLLRSQTRANYRMRATEAGQMKLNADVKSSRAAVQSAINAENQRRRREAGQRLTGTQRARFAAANIVESTGSPLSVLAETAGLVQRDMNEQQYFNDLAVDGLYQEAALERLGGEYALAGATMDRATGLTEAKLTEAGAQATLLTGLRKASITRMSGRAESQGLQMGAFGNLLSGGASIYKQYAS